MAKQRMRILASAVLVATGLLALHASAAHASPLLDLVGDTTSAGGGLQARSVPGGAAAAYFDPALLIDAPAGLTVGFMLLHQRIDVSLAGRPGAEFAVPEGIANAQHADGSRFDNYPIPTNWLQFGRPKDARHDAFVARPRQAAGSGHGTSSYEALGLTVKLFEDRLALGIYGLIPNGEFTELRAFFNDEREQYFSNSLHPELYSDRMTAVSFAFGAGIKLLEGLSLGVGATLGLEASVGAPTYVADTGHLNQILIDMNAGVNVGIAPHFGVSYQPIDRLRLTATAHTPERVDLETSFTFLLSTGVEQSSGIKLVLDYTPWQLALGASYDLVKQASQTLTVAGTALYARWSDYVDRHGFAPTPAYAWADTISPVLGARYRIHDLTTSLDVSYVPTPVPDQTGRTNYVDNDRATASAGAEYRFAVWGTDLNVGAALQAHRLLPRSQAKLPTRTRADGEDIAPERVKDELPDDAELGGDPLPDARGLQTNNPGWPGFGSAGWIFGATLYATVAF
jgi:hypothetical protein